MKHKLIGLFLFFQIAFLFAEAQEVFNIKGVIFNIGKNQRIDRANITNLKTGESVNADEWGVFAISSSIGDTLFFSKPGFQELTKVIAVKQNLIIYMKPNLVLDEVIVKEKTKGAEQREILDGYRSKGVFFNGNPPLLAYFFSPLTALHEIFGKDANNAKRFGNYITRENSESLVDKHFNKYLITTHTNIKEENIAEFMYLHRPKADEVMYWNNYDDIKYVKDAYEKFIKEKGSK